MTDKTHELQDRIAGLQSQLKATQIERDAALHMNQQLIKEKAEIKAQLDEANKAIDQLLLDATRLQSMIEEIKWC